MRLIPAAPKVSPEAQRIANWLRFEGGAPAVPAQIEKGTGIRLTVALIGEGEKTGLFRFSNSHKGFI